MAFRYGVLCSSASSILVICKVWFFPYVLHRTLAIGDLGALLYEMGILILGSAALIMYVLLGHIGKYRFRLGRRRQLSVALLLQTPFFLHGWLKMASVNPRTITPLYEFAEGWCSLIAEPIRLLFFVYPWTDIIAVTLSLLLVWIGRGLRTEIDDFFFFWEYKK